MLHTLMRGELELSASLESKSSLLGDSSGMVSSDGEPLVVMPPNPASELAPFG
jgi:hypothetical protein